jgi:hypothetical protein
MTIYLWSCPAVCFTMALYRCWPWSPQTKKRGCQVFKAWTSGTGRPPGNREWERSPPACASERSLAALPSPGNGGESALGDLGLQTIHWAGLRHQRQRK